MRSVDQIEGVRKRSVLETGGAFTRPTLARHCERGNRGRHLSKGIDRKKIEGWPYKRMDELVRKRIIRVARYERVKDRIIPKQATAKR